MNLTKTPNRLVPLLLGFAIMTIKGMCAYVWSLFIKPIQMEFPTWTVSDISLALSFNLLTVGISSIIAGQLTERWGPRVVVVLGGLIYGTGFILTSFATSKLEIYLFFGLITGTGGGMIYIPPVTLMPKWWPDRKAFAVGAVIVGLGVGAFILPPVATWMMSTEGMTWRQIFAYVGIAMACVPMIAGSFLKNPPPGWKPPASAKTPKKIVPVYAGLTHSETLRTPQFYLLALAFFTAGFAGLVVIGHLAHFGDSVKLPAIWAAASVSAFSIANAATRILSGVIVDKMSIKVYFTIISVPQVVAISLLYPLGSTTVGIITLAIIIGWNFGAIFTLFPTYCLQFFGSRAQASNYGLLFFSFGLAGFFGPFIAGWLKDKYMTYEVPFLVAAASVAVCALIVAFVKPPVIPEAERVR